MCLPAPIQVTISPVHQLLTWEHSGLPPQGVRQTEPHSSAHNQPSTRLLQRLLRVTHLSAACGQAAAAPMRTRPSHAERLHLPLNLPREPPRLALCLMTCKQCYALSPAAGMHAAAGRPCSGCQAISSPPLEIGTLLTSRVFINSFEAFDRIEVVQAPRPPPHLAASSLGSPCDHQPREPHTPAAAPALQMAGQHCQLQPQPCQPSPHTGC